MPIPNPNPYIVKTSDLALGDTFGTPLSGVSGPLNKATKDMQGNIDFLENFVSAITVVPSGGTYSVLSTDSILYVSGPKSIILPFTTTVSASGKIKEYIIFNDSTQTVTISGNSGELINGLGYVQVYFQNETIELFTKGNGKWHKKINPQITKGNLDGSSSIASLAPLVSGGNGDNFHIHMSTGFATNLEVHTCPPSGTLSGTFTVPEGVTKLKVELWGGGGSGGIGNTSTDTMGGGGGGGGYGCSVVTVSGGQQIPWVAGSGAIGAFGANNISGNNGGKSIVTIGATTIEASGGNMGTPGSPNQGGAGGGVANAQISIYGQAGYGGGTSTFGGSGGAGGNGGIGGWGDGRQNVAGRNGITPGGGGAGLFGSSTVMSGGGGQGRIIFWW